MAKSGAFDIFPRHLRPAPMIVTAVADDADLQQSADEWCRRQEVRNNLPTGTLRAELRTT